MEQQQQQHWPSRLAHLTLITALAGATATAAVVGGIVVAELRTGLDETLTAEQQLTAELAEAERGQVLVKVSTVDAEKVIADLREQLASYEGFLE